MNGVRDDLVELSDYAWQRLHRRLEGLGDREYFWTPVAGCRTVRPTGEGSYRSDGPVSADEATPASEAAGFTTLAWRLSHIVDVLSEDRNGPWLGRSAAGADRTGDPGSAAEALAELDRAYARWKQLLVGTTDKSLQEPIGAVAGRYGNATRRSFLLHVVDELIHHGAEAALLRDLYATEPQLDRTESGRPAS